MKTKLFTLLVCVVFAATACKSNNKTNKHEDSTTTETADTSATTEATPQLSEEEINKIYMDYMTPGDMHKWMAETVGEWDVQTISYMG